jgi:hypothetical protein
MEVWTYGEKGIWSRLAAPIFLLPNFRSPRRFLGLFVFVLIPFESLLFSSATRSADFKLYSMLHIWRRIAGRVRRLDRLYIIYEILSSLGNKHIPFFFSRKKILIGLRWRTLELSLVDALACLMQAVAEASLSSYLSHPSFTSVSAKSSHCSV